MEVETPVVLGGIQTRIGIRENEATDDKEPRYRCGGKGAIDDGFAKDDFVVN